MSTAARPLGDAMYIATEENPSLAPELLDSDPRGILAANHGQTAE